MKPPIVVAASAALTLGAWRTSVSLTSDVPYYRTEQRTPEWLSNRIATDSAFHRVAPFALRDQHNARITEANLNGRITVVHFFFTQCGGVCPTTQGNLARLLLHFPDEARLQLLSHSVTPDRDSVPALNMYAAMRGITDSRWHLLTGQRASIEALASASYFVNLNDGKTYGVNNLAHTETLVLVDGMGRLRGMYTGTLQLDVDRMSDDIRTLLHEQR